eukprot:358443_1
MSNTNLEEELKEKDAEIARLKAKLKTYENAASAVDEKAKESGDVDSYDFKHDSFKNSALILVDIQKDFYEKDENVNSNFPDFPANIKSLLTFARKDKEFEVIFVREKDVIGESPWYEWYKALHPSFELTQTEPASFCHNLESEKVIIKRTCDAFLGTHLDTYLKYKGIKKLYFCGLLTHACVLNSFLTGFNLGYEIYLIANCCGGRSRQFHFNTIRMFDGYL